MMLKICDFTITPGGRYRKDGKYSGEEFREDFLIPAFETAVKEKNKLHIDLDGTYGYPSSFLEEAFGGLARKYSNIDVLSFIVLKSDEDPEEINRIVKYVEENI